MADSRIDELRRRLERDPGSRLFAQLAEEYRKAGQHADAIRVARTGLALHPSYPSARLTLGRALLDSGDAAGARVELEATLREAPDNILASRFLGEALDALGELGPALVQLEATLKMAPGDRQLAGHIASLQSRLRAPQPAPAPRPEAVAAVAPSGATAPPRRPAQPPPAESDAGDGAPLPPTIRIHGAENRGFWERKPTEPPAAPAVTAAPTTSPIAPLAAVGGAPVARPPRPPEPVPAADDSDAAPTAPAVARSEGDFLDETAGPPAAGREPQEAGRIEEVAGATRPTRVVAAEETVFEPELPLEPVPQTPGPEAAGGGEEAAGAGATPFSSSTLAELYLRQGVVDRAVEVYRQVLAEEPGNDRARSRLAEIEGGPPPDEAREARRRALERTIAGLEALLGALQRR